MNEKMDIRFLARQRRYAAEWAAKKKASPPAFSLGASWLETDAADEDAAVLERALTDWASNPRAWFRKLSRPAVARVDEQRFLIQTPDGDKSAGRRHKASVFSRELPKSISGGRIAVIIVPQWNPRLKSYLRRTRITQNVMLPLSTFVYIPHSNNGFISVARRHEMDFETVSPNIGKTLQRCRNDVVNIIALARHLKEKEGYQQVGLFSYSLGSLRSLLSHVVDPEAFDYAVFHLVAADFAEAVLGGASTQAIADVLRAHVAPEDIKRFWRPLAPEAYAAYFDCLGPSVRLAQARYDLAFGLENVGRFTAAFRARARAEEVEEGEYGHYYGWREWPRAFGMLRRDLKFIYRVTGLKYWR